MRLSCRSGGELAQGRDRGVGECGLTILVCDRAACHKSPTSRAVIDGTRCSFLHTTQECERHVDTRGQCRGLPLMYLHCLQNAYLHLLFCNNRESIQLDELHNFFRLARPNSVGLDDGKRLFYFRHSSRPLSFVAREGLSQLVLTFLCDERLRRRTETVT